MSAVHVEYSAVIDARPETVYDIIADYEVGHRAILPQPYFQEMTILKGGRGAGTELRLKIVVFGQEYHYHQLVSEPEPGRVIVEKDLNSKQFSWFTLDPVGNGEQTRVTISSEFPRQAGFAGVMQRLFQPQITRRMYRQELENLNDYMKQTMRQQATAS